VTARRVKQQLELKFTGLIGTLRDWTLSSNRHKVFVDENGPDLATLSSNYDEIVSHVRRRLSYRLAEGASAADRLGEEWHWAGVAICDKG
jgi:hypothetical protein